MKRFGQLVFTVLLVLIFNTPASADAEVGSTVEWQLNLGKRTFALPPGKWTVVNSSDDVATTGVSSTGRIKQQYLVLTTANNQFVAAVNVRTTTSSANATSWNDSNCDRKDTLFRDTFNSSFSFPACLLVNHVVNFGNNGVPSNEYDKKIYNWFRESKITLPKTAVHSFYVRYFAGDFVHIRYSLNPELAGVEADTATVWNQSQWHPELIKANPDRVRYVEAVKNWNKAFVVSSDQSLRENKAQAVGLPPMPVLSK